MAKQSRRPRSSLIDALERDPGSFELFQAIRLAERAVALARAQAGHALPDAVGRGVDPRQASVRLSAGSQLSFAGSEVTRAQLDPGMPAQLTQQVIGLTGTSGALPHTFSELVQTSLRERNLGVRDFFDLFNDRLAALFYDAFTKYRLILQTERRPLIGGGGIDEVVRAVVGLNTPALQDRTAAPDSLALHHAGLLSRTSRSAHAVEKVLSNAFAQPIRVEQFVGEWLPIALPERTQLGSPASSLGKGAFSQLGVDAVLGVKAWSFQGRVRLLIGPLDFATFEGFLPGRPRQRRLADLAALCLGPDLSFTQRLTLNASEVPSLRLGGGPDAFGANRLGWNTWIGSKARRRAQGIVDLAPASALTSQ